MLAGLIENLLKRVGKKAQNRMVSLAANIPRGTALSCALESAAI
jgi:hypothetical protein